MSDRMEALVIGIDAGCLPVFERLFEEDRTPTIERLCSEDGASAPLESQIPPWTPSAWPSIYTGVNPGKHGVFGFVDYDGYDWRVVTSQTVRDHALWEILDERGLSSVVVNAPVTHPPAEFDGVLVPGFIGPESPTCHPEGTLEELRSELGEYRVYPNYSRTDDTVPRSEKKSEYESLIRMRGEAFRYLAAEHDPDFGFLQFQRTDTVFHEFDGDEEMVDAVYEETDRQIEAVLDEVDPERVFLVSDHGIGPYEKEEFRVNEFLKDEGYVEATAGGKGMPGWAPIRDDLEDGEDVETWEPNLTEKLVATAARLGLTTTRIRKGLEKVRLDDVARRYAPDNITRTGSEHVDFPNSKAYMRARTELGVRINLQGRDPDGVVPPEEYDDLRAEIIEKLRAVTDPAGDPVFDEVAPRERYFDGQYEDDAVDIVVIPNDFEHFLSDQLRGEYFGPPTEPWNHKLDGVFAASGDGVDADAMPEHPHLFDVAPTVLSALGVPYSDRTDGEVMPIVDDVGSHRYPEYGADGASADADPGSDVEDRLADLGYLD